MTLREAKRGRRYLLWDDIRLAEPFAGLFDPDWWRVANALAGEAQGRGATYFLQGCDGVRWVLRHNRRGGVLAQINRDQFLWTGVDRLRPLAELRLLADMRTQHLPVPAPVAARAVRIGPVYRADVITVAIEGAQTLVARLAAGSLSARAWRALGALLAEFHEAGIWHADLNARNILCAEDGVFYLIDFDKARKRSPGNWRATNLARLRRSLDKCKQADAGFGFRKADWAALRDGYASAGSAGGSRTGKSQRNK